MPPLPGVGKRIAGSAGVTRVGPVTVGRFTVRERPDGAALAYRWPLRAVVDEVRPAPDGGWLGTMRVFGRAVGDFRMRRAGPG
jgi:hypothetical protein